MATIFDCIYSIKRAYRKKALELHPDRNYGSLEDTTKLFAEVQAAYDVLSDPQERAWYDSHRDAIVRGNPLDPSDRYEQDVRMTTANDIVRLFTKFNGSIEFSDSSSGFYGLMRDTFEVLAREEDAACEFTALEPVDYPSFGYANDDYEHVAKPFYAAWSGFATSKSFSWKTAFRYSDAPDRRVRRMMEKENKRLRDEGIREYNDAVRSMVAFVRKRDPRYIPNSQSEAERQKVLRDAASAQAARSRVANQAKLDEYVRPEWTRTQASGMSGDSEEEDEAEEERIEECYECVACGKTFKSEKQFEVHEKSKRHMKAVRQLKKTMQNDQEVLHLDDSVHGEVASSLGKIQAESQARGSEIDSDLPGSSKGGLALIDLDTTGNEIDLDNRSDSSSSHSGIFLPSKNAHLDKDLDSDNDQDAPREQFESRIPGGTYVSYSCSGEGNESTDVTRGCSALSLEDDSAPPSPKLGKAKMKRAQRAIRKEGTRRDGAEVGPTTSLSNDVPKLTLFASSPAPLAMRISRPRHSSSNTFPLRGTLAHCRICRRPRKGRSDECRGD